MYDSSSLRLLIIGLFSVCCSRIVSILATYHVISIYVGISLPQAYISSYSKRPSLHFPYSGTVRRVSWRMRRLMWTLPLSKFYTKILNLFHPDNTRNLHYKDRPGNDAGCWKLYVSLYKLFL